MDEVDERCREDEPLFRQGWAEGLRYVLASLGSRMEPEAVAWLRANTERIDAEQSRPAAAVPEAPACQVRWDSRRLAWVCSHMASAVPEAQDGRERENRWNDALNEANRRHGGHRRVVAPLLALADAEVAASAAVREGERERLAAAWGEGFKAGGRWSLLDEEWFEDSQSFDEDDLLPRPPKPANPFAAPSLAAPEGTEQ